ncbi:MAG: ergothioneine biosynthesis protein EgtB [Pseudoalteromonas sp.]|uniref:ergothioneine biosynthesis protein EgtB n=1 Tax=unclassified Pseudoalteromonas TaxID=194690 RepID=UPI003F976607
MIDQRITASTLNESLILRFKQTRQVTRSIISDLSTEDCQLQAMADVSPSKWHLAHTSWFFETFLLKAHMANYTEFNKYYTVLFNSYYNGIGSQFSRAQRGCLSRPSLTDILSYREYIDNQVTTLLSATVNHEHFEIVELGINHEQQHQELMLMDIKYNFSVNPIFPSYRKNDDKPSKHTSSSAMVFYDFDQSIINIGAMSEGFSYDNERPCHQVLSHDFSLANRLVTNGEYLAFIEAKGYQNPEYWLSDGWAHINTLDTKAPLYWHLIEGCWFEFTLHGLKKLDLNAPVSHVSFYEASAYAAFADARLPTEFEWERAASSPERALFSQLDDCCWQWTNSSYLPYPGFQPIAGVAGEYNGKFMSNQMVLRGGCALTPDKHLRVSYRNFYYAHQAWMQSGIRLAKDKL